jgi:hypothetical protein
MALAMFHQAMQLTVVAGYESGHTIVLQHSNGSAGAKSTWRRLCVFQPHSQPGKWTLSETNPEPLYWR